jgi:hypothetical protein
MNELEEKLKRYEKALKEIYQKGGYKIRGNVANELAEIANKALSQK